MTRKADPLTQYIQNRRNRSKFNGSSPLQNCNGLISLEPAIAYFAYTQRYGQVQKNKESRNYK